MNGRLLKDFGLAVGALAVVAWAISPGRSTAKLIEEIGGSMGMWVHVAQGVRKHDPEVIPDFRELSEARQLTLKHSLSHADQMWLESMLSEVTDGE